VAVAERDGYNAPNAIPDDPLFGELWGLRNLGTGIQDFPEAVAGADINVADAWLRTVGSPATVIADLDSGYRFEHPDLANVAWTNPDEIPSNSVDDDGNGYVDDVHGYDFIGADGEAPAPDNDPTDDDLLYGGHGVHTAGTLGAQGNNGIGITGVAQDVSIMPLRICSRFELEEESLCRFSSQVAAINYAGANGARAANMSLGGTFNSTIVSDAIAANPQTLFVISAGNDGEDNDSEPHYPCNYNPLAEGKGPVDNVICVAATDQADELAGFSDWGAISVDIGAPGTEILSAFPLRRIVDEDFEVDDFGSKWAATGVDGGFARTDEAPLKSFGMSDSPGAAPVAGSIKRSTSDAVPLPAGFDSCTLEQTRTVSLGGGTYSYEVLLDGSPVAGASPSSSGRFSLELEDDLIAGGEVSVRFRYMAGGSPTVGNGVWLDDIGLECPEPIGLAASYAYLAGTSMAAPHVSGAAGLLFSLEPSATVTEVREALLSGVDAIPSLAGKTTTNGRLNLAKAMDSLEGIAVDNVAPPKPILSGTVPGSGADDNHPRVKGSAEASAVVTLFGSFTCGGAPVAQGTAEELAGAGIGVTVPDNSITFLSARAADAARNKSACSTPTSYLEDSPPVVIEGPPDEAEKAVEPARTPSPITQPPNPTCVVPKLAGKTLSQGQAALASARCKLGKVTKPKARKGRRLPRLVVKSSSPAAGATTASAVNLTLGPKPKKRHH
jgi:subtilisin family serine protease